MEGFIAIKIAFFRRAAALMVTKNRPVQARGGFFFGRSRSYFSISEIERWMKSERLLPLSMPLESSARSMICFTSSFSAPISRSRSLRSSRSVTIFFDSSSRVDFSSAVSSSSF